MFIQRRIRVSKQPYHCFLGRHVLSFNWGPKSVIFTAKQDDNRGSPKGMDVRQLTDSAGSQQRDLCFPLINLKPKKGTPLERGLPVCAILREYMYPREWNALSIASCTRVHTVSSQLESLFYTYFSSPWATPRDSVRENAEFSASFLCSISCHRTITSRPWVGLRIGFHPWRWFLS